MRTPTEHVWLARMGLDEKMRENQSSVSYVFSVLMSETSGQKYWLNFCH